MESEFWTPGVLRFAVSFTAILYVLGIYLFMLPAFIERLRHPHSMPVSHLGSPRRIPLYILIYILSPLLFIGVFVMMVLMGALSVFSVLMLMVMSPFHWLFSQLPPNNSRWSIIRWRRFGGRMFEHSRKMFSWLAGEQPMKEMQTLKEHPGKK